MAKRFTDTDKWKNPWFRELPNTYRWLWLYILDNCDNAGIWRIDFSLASYCIGSKIDVQEAEEIFEGKYFLIDHDKWFIPSFVTFQYGSLKDDSRPHQSVVKILLKYGIDPKSIHTLSIEYPKSIHTLKDKYKDKDKDKDQDKNKEKESEKFLEAFALYPIRTKGPNAVQRFNEQIRSEQDFVDLLQSIKHYCAHLAKPENSWKAPKQSFATYLGTKASGFFWRDWISPEAGESKIQKTAGGKDWDVMTVPLGGRS